MNSNEHNKLSFLNLVVLVLAGESIFLLPYIIVRVFRPVMLEVFDFSNTQLGVAMSFYGMTALVAYLIGGPFADKFKPRKLIGISLAVTALGGLYLSTYPSFNGVGLLYAFWGVSTILLFWSSLIKATRQSGSSDTQGKAFGILEMGRGLFSAIIASTSVFIFAFFMPEDIENLTNIERQNAFRYVILFITGFVFLSSVIVWFFLKEDDTDNSKHDGIDVEKLKIIVKNPAIWLQGIIILCAYVGYKSVNNFSQYSSDILGMNDVESSVVGSLALWLRPAAAILAGLVADKVKASKLMPISFGLIILGAASMASGLINDTVIPLFFISIVGACIGIFSMRTLYFAIMEEAKIPLAFTGTVVGLVSVIGYAPDIFFYPLQGVILDGYPGLKGHQLFYMVLALFALIGLIASFGFNQVSKENTLK